MSDFALRHYAVAVHDIDEGAATYGRLLGLERGEGGRDDSAGLEWLALGFAGERSLLLVAPLNEASALHVEMAHRARERNPHGEGFHSSTWHAGDPAALARHFVERTASLANDAEARDSAASDAGETGGSVRLDARVTHGLPMTLARLPEPPPRSVWPSHIAVAVANLDAAEATFARGLGLDVERHFEADYGDFAASALYTGGREVLALMTGRSETSAVARRMRGMASEENPLGEGFYLASWARAIPPRSPRASSARAGWSRGSERASTSTRAPRTACTCASTPPPASPTTTETPNEATNGAPRKAPLRPLHRRGEATRRASRRCRSRSR